MGGITGEGRLKVALSLDWYMYEPLAIPAPALVTGRFSATGLFREVLAASSRFAAELPPSLSPHGDPLPTAVVANGKGMALNLGPNAKLAGREVDPDLPKPEGKPKFGP